MKLFCVAHAGGSASIYEQWKGQMERIEILPLELIGHGRRGPMQQSNISMETYVEDLYEQMSSQMSDAEYSIFGHSMGAIIVYELCKKMQHLNKKKPQKIFFSGKQAPHLPQKNKLSLYENKVFWKKIYLMGGVEEEIYAEKELLDFFYPLMKNDFEIVDNYYEKEPCKLNTPICIINGTMDRFEENEIIAWKDYSSIACDFYKVVGDHFYLKKNIKDTLNIIKQELL